MSRSVAVTGMGIFSAIGKDLEENHSSLIHGKHGLSTPEILETIHQKLPIGEIKATNTALAKSLNLDENHAFTRAALLGTIALKEALENAKIKDFTNIGFVNGTSVGGMDMTERFYREYENDKTNRRFIQAQHPGFTTEQIAGYFEINNYVTTISTACSSAANAIMMGARLIKSGRLDRVIVGGTDCLSRFTLNGFNSLMIYSEDFPKPFDAERKGLNLGEAAAYLVLESSELAENKEILAYVSGYGNANDAFHQTASSENGEGAYLAMQKALKTAKLNPHQIDYINAHGTATQNNDLSESRALIRTFKEMPAFSSTKSFTGHTLAAAGGIEAVFSLLAIKHQQIYPNLNFESVINETKLEPVTELKSAKIDHVLSNSFGFGGNCTSLIFSKNG
ncbi:beta-ketoacyl-[acyl-carrier-protein] synthase family protein [Zunongwangia sp. SCSIO 43204]|uniref:beta-ketoacyl-[acyl-carrier-protein] synthase family protein n=1 Tax=Zunongwangia sp. SCSIO 43204 TaxID=2779359 RepID=UPI001CA89F38|nr:beta-ketoacyl-[acyl-carrier-protein] synthase family protein [Zunongwangia sp. SCSIO 43204]UAB83492.1 beta-ketoacyl-[acyl-carrier-protein] synthase family protein [Zunongwangia sp. SCSIO 43204]